MSHKEFWLAMLEKIMKEWTLGSHLVMKITPRVPGYIIIMDIGQKYNSQKMLGFIANDWNGSIIQVIPIYLFPLKIIMMFLFDLLFVLTCLSVISMTLMQ